MGTVLCTSWGRCKAGRKFYKGTAQATAWGQSTSWASCMVPMPSGDSELRIVPQWTGAKKIAEGQGHGERSEGSYEK